MCNTADSRRNQFASNSSKDVRLPVQLQRAMAAEAEATREARAKVCVALVTISFTNMSIIEYHKTYTCSNDN